jgi:hypothetical protein
MSQDNLLINTLNANKEKSSDENETGAALHVKVNFLNSEIKHLEQKTKNDCGVAVTRMALKFLKFQILIHSYILR